MNINYENLSEKDKGALDKIESNRSIDEPTADEVIRTQFGGDPKKYLKAMGVVT